MKIQSVRGVKDILPGEVEKWQWVESVAQETFSRYGYREIRPPVFEKTHLFSRSIGETTDIVEKEMYTFPDRGGDSITLRPEGTASVVRAYIQNKLYNPPSVARLYYIGPMFRYERPQAGRLRQFHQIGVEAMGSASPMVDVEVMAMLLDFFHRLGLTELQLQLNSLGCKECRPHYRETLKDAIKGHLDVLCENCNQRYERNPMRVLDCKVDRCSEIAAQLPKTMNHLCETCDREFNEVKTLLDGLGAAYALNPRLVRGLDYYNKTAFEVTSKGLGAQNALCGGGRYDSLVEEFEGPSTPCFGFALGMERLISVIPFENLDSLKTKLDVFVITLGDAAKREGFKIAQTLRGRGLSVAMDYEGGSMKSQMRKANKACAQNCLILGDNEIQSGVYQLKNMESGEQSDIPAQGLAENLLRKLSEPS